MFVDLDTLVVDLPHLDSRYGGNSRVGYRQRNRLAQEAKATAKLAVLDHMNRKGIVDPWQQVSVSVIWQYTNKSHRPDPDNAFSRIKYYLDGAVLAGLLPNDTPDHIKQLTLSYKRAAQPGVQLIFVRLEDDNA